MGSLRMRYYHRLNANHLFLPQMIIDLGEVTTYFILGFKKLKIYAVIYLPKAILKL